MAQIDRVLLHLNTLFEIWGWEDHSHACDELLSKGDEAKARRWLYRTLKQFEECPDMGWSERQSGVVLFNSGMISIEEIILGAGALLHVVGCEVTMAEAPD